MVDEFDLKKRTFSGLFAVGSAKALTIALSLLSLVLLSRILTPNDFGVVAMAAPVLTFLTIVQGMGITQATIQQDTIRKKDRDVLFTTTILTSFLISTLLIASSPAIAIFYDNRDAGKLVAASALVAVITGLSIQHNANLNREMQFGSLARLEAISSLIGFISSVALALYLRSFWALWLGSVLTALAKTIGMRHADAWKPRLNFDFRSVRHLHKFGRHVAASQFLAFLSRNADNVLLGRFGNAAALGQYSRAYQLIMFPLQSINSPITQVFLPLLSRHRKDKPLFNAIYLRIIDAAGLIMIPPLIVISFYREETSLLLFGPGWDVAGEALRWLALTACYQVVTTTNGIVFTSLGKPEIMFRWSRFGAPLTVAAFLIGAPWGAAATALAYFCAETIKTPLLLNLISRNTGISLRRLFLTYACPVGAGLAAVGLGKFIQPISLGEWIVPAVAFAGLITSLAFGLLVPHSRRLIFEGAAMLTRHSECSTSK